MSGLRGEWTEKLYPTYYCGLTARPVVLAKTHEPGTVTVPALKGWSGLDVPPLIGVATSPRRVPISVDHLAARGFAAASPPRRASCLDPVAASSFGAVECLIGCFDHLVNRKTPVAGAGHTDARRNRKFGGRRAACPLPEREAGWGVATRPRITAVRTARILSAVGAPKSKAAGFNVGAQLFQMIQHVCGGFAGEDDGKFFTAATIGLGKLCSR